MKKLFSFLILVTVSLSPFGAGFAEAQFSSYEFGPIEWNPPEFEFPDLEFDNQNPDHPNNPDIDESDIPEECTIPLRDLRTVLNFPPKTGPIIAFGDSLTAGVGATPGQDYVSELERLADVNIVNEGISGNTTLDALARLNRDVLSQNPSVVIVWLGGNDILNRYYQELDEEASDTVIERLLDAIFEFFGKDPNREEVITENETFENIEEIIERIQSTGAVTIVVGMDGEPLNNDLGGRYLDVAQDTHSIFIPDVLDDILGRPTLTSDLIHPNNRGYDIVAQRVYNGFACVLEADEETDEEESGDDDDGPDDEEPNPPPSNGGTRRVCVDTDNDGYKECSYVRDGSGNPDEEDEDDEEPEEDEEEATEDDTPTGSLRRVCVDTDNDGYKECSYTRS